MLVLGAAFTPSASRADVQLSSSFGRYQINEPCEPVRFAVFELGQTVSDDCFRNDDGDTASASIQSSSSIVNGARGVESVSLSTRVTLSGSFAGADASVVLNGWFEVTAPTPYVLTVQPTFNGQIEGVVTFDGQSHEIGCDCLGTDCSGSLGCGQGTTPLVLSGELPRGNFSFRTVVRAYLAGDQDVRTGSASLQATIRFGRTSQTYNWTNLNGGDYALDGNWDPHGVPTHDAQVSDVAIFHPGLYGVNVVGAKAGRFVVRQADVELIGDAQVYDSIASPPSLEIEGDASLQLNGSSVLRGVHAVVGSGSAANANEFSAILLDDAATQLVLSGDLSVGSDIPGLVAVDGGFLQAADLRLGGAARGQMDIAGVDAAAMFNDLFVGSSQGVGIVRVTAGGLLNIANMEIGGNNLTDPVEQVTNTVKVSGRAANSTPSRLLATGDIRVGEDGSADLSILDGAYVEAGSSVTLGANDRADALVKSSDPMFPSILRAGPRLQIGEGNGAGLIIEPGGQVEASEVRLNFGGQVGGGELTIDGQGQSNSARMKVTQELLVGGNPQATPVFVKNGGVLTALSATIGNDALLTDEATVVVGTLGGGDTVPAEFNVVDPNSAQLTGGLVTIVGGAGPGRLNIAGGAIARLTGALRIGHQADGAMSVDNSGSTAGLRSTAILSDIATLGWTGAGDLAISNGGLVTSNSDIVVGFMSIGEIRAFNGQGFTGDRAELRMLGSELEIGLRGSGELNVQGGGLVGCARLVVGGYDIAAAGEVLVDTGGEIKCLADMLVGAVNVGAGSVTVGPAGTLVVDGVLTVGGTSEGQIALTDATSRVSAGIISGASTFVNNHGSIVGVGTLATSRLVIAPGGFVSPGLSPGTLTIDGDYEQQEGATLVIEVAGLAPGQFDVLKVTGSATLAGKVQMKFIDGYVPNPGDTIDCLQVEGTTTGQPAIETVDADGQPAQVGATAQLTPEGAYRLTIGDGSTDTDGNTTPDTDGDTSADAEGLPTIISACGNGACGSGVATLLPFSLVTMVRWRRKPRRHKSVG